ncbi:putative zinc finger protein 66 [Salvelinus fontinalis]|uniref:putative zinc finger protein 66 n=1 Tax=Salvelinus fontinalis TaxID=8038 RepID=UPI002485C292|nr:putative zinc finger protein 66 [Salvelinus fontinalis]XP_055770845.1 putative zinc finger protein 66 [Salvelinus fontinalis]
MMKAHALGHLSEQPRPCPHGGSFRTVYDPSHQLVTRPFLCVKCLKAFRTARILHNHKVHHMEDRDHTFEDCNKTPHHLKLHSEDTPYVYPDRGKGFLQPDRLTLHRRTHVTEPKSRKTRHKCSMSPW